ncbi:MAG: hypothetical protein N3A38_11385, partial [Planctomycetota bacterium]|nr:hypothetical protein [Planctomycetota bacterium]
MRKFMGSFCDRHKELEVSGPATVFYGVRFRVPSRMKLAALLGYDGPVKAWLDGKEVFYDPNGTNPAKPDAARIPFDGKPGTHELLVALDSNGGRAWGIFLRFERTDAALKALRSGKPVAMPAIEGNEQPYFDGVALVSPMAARGEGRTAGGRRR